MHPVPADVHSIIGGAPLSIVAVGLAPVAAAGLEPGADGAPDGAPPSTDADS